MSAVEAQQTLLDRLREFEGKLAGEPIVARDVVNEAMIRHWCDAIGDGNPIYTDADAARAVGHDGIVAPPTMLQSWVMRGLAPPTPGPRGPGSPMPELLQALADEGFPAIVATNCDQEYARYLRVGDRVTATTVVDRVSEEKQTALGAGHFVTTKVTFTDQHGEPVSTQRFRMLVYRPNPPKPQAGARPRPAMNQDTAFFWEGAQRGELLIQRCSSCGTLRHPPRPACPSCRSLEWDTQRASGRGTVHSYVVHHHPPVPGFEPPYVVVLVELEEGTRLVSNLVGVDPGEVSIGMPVEVTFERIDDELTLPLFREVEH
ncbi:MAG: OB-fold domain-containing protein [Actinomycetota bacterium]